MIFLFFAVSILAGIHFAKTSRLQGFQYFFVSLFRGEFIVAVAIWTCVVLGIIGIPKNEALECFSQFLEVSRLHVAACFAIRLADNYMTKS